MMLLVVTSTRMNLRVQALITTPTLNHPLHLQVDHPLISMRGVLKTTRKGRLRGRPLHPLVHQPHGLNTIEPNVPARLLPGPAAKKRRLVDPFAPRPSPKSIPHNWLITMAFPFVSFTLPTNCPVKASNALIVP